MTSNILTGNKLIKRSKLLEVYLLLILFYSSSIWKIIIADSSRITNTFNWIIVWSNLFIVCTFLFSKSTYIRKNSLVNSFAGILTLYIIFFIIVQTIYAYVKYGKPILNSLIALRNYINVLLVFPVIYVHNVAYKDKKDDCCGKGFDKIIVITVIALILRMLISFYYFLTGTIIWENIAREYAAENWIRNGVLRINPTAFGVVLPLMSLYMIDYKKKNRKYIYISAFIISCIFTLCISQTRIDMMAILVSVIFFFFANGKLDKKKFLCSMLFFIIIGYVLYFTDIPKEFFNTFSTKGEYGMSTLNRINEIDYYGKLFKEHPFLGLGPLNASDTSLTGLLRGRSRIYYLEDLGALGAVFNYGISGVVIFLALFGRLFYIILKLKNVKKVRASRLKAFVVSYIAYLIIFSIGHDMLYIMYSWAVPFLHGAIESEYYQIRHC